MVEVTSGTGASPLEMMTVADVGGLLRCSTRHVYRLCDQGAMPRPIKLGNLNRWRRIDLENWLAAGGKPVRIPVASRN